MNITESTDINFQPIFQRTKEWIQSCFDEGSLCETNLNEIAV